MGRTEKRWARIDVGYLEDEVLALVAAESGYPLTTWALWPALVALAKGSSGRSNPEGTISTSAVQLARKIGTKPAEVEAVLEVLEEGELAEIERGKIGTLKITLEAFARWQTAAGTKAERDERYDTGPRKARAGKKADKSDASPTGARLARAREGEKREEKDQEITSDPGGSNPPSKRELEEQAITRILEHLNRATARNLKPTKARRSKVRARLGEGFTEAELIRAADFYATSPWHQGENPTGTRYDAPETVFRDAGQIERALDTSSSSQPTTGAAFTADDLAKMRERRAMRAAGYTEENA